MRLSDLEDMRNDINQFEKKWLYIMDKEREQFRNDLREYKNIISTLNTKINDLEEEKKLLHKEIRKLKPFQPYTKRV